MSRGWDIIGIIGILIVIAGGILVYFEAEQCKNPLQTVVQQVLENKNVSDFEYAYVRLEFYKEGMDFPISEYEINYDGTYRRRLIGVEKMELPKFNMSLKE